MKPKHITFTGADEATDIGDMVALAKQYPIEWGILMHPRCSRERYPGPEWMREVAKVDGLDLSMHICGQFADDIVSKGAHHFQKNYNIESIIDLLGGPIQNWQRAQVNHRMPSIYNVVSFFKRYGVKPILQCNSGDFFPKYDRQHVDWLYDASCGRGVVPDKWPLHDGRGFLGFAGGLSPDNVGQIFNHPTDDYNNDLMRGKEYWIDMETGVRTDNVFDLDKCRQVCEIVYGAMK